MRVSKYYDWNEQKNQLFREERGVSFEEVVLALESNQRLATIQHPNQDRYPNQQTFVVVIERYVYLAPFIEDEVKVFLKTIIPSRKATREYLIQKGKL